MKKTLEVVENLDARVTKILELSVKFPMSWERTPSLALELTNGGPNPVIPSHIIMSQKRMMVADIYSQFKKGKVLTIKAKNLKPTAWPEYLFEGLLNFEGGPIYEIRFRSFANGTEGNLWPSRKELYIYATVDYFSLSQASSHQSS